MHRKLTMFFILALFCTGLFAQTTPVSFKIEPYGVSPRDVEKSTTDIYTNAFNGLKNAGVNTKMYFIATITGQDLAATVTWTVTRKPVGSKAAVGATVDKINSKNLVAAFTPDKPGAYELTATSGAYSAKIVINAAKYLGYTNTFVDGVNKNVNCQTCHKSFVTEWLGTDHAIALQRNLNGGVAGNHFDANCVSCHSTGYDKNAANDGFDDFPFTFPKF